MTHDGGPVDCILVVQVLRRSWVMMCGWLDITGLRGLSVAGRYHTAREGSTLRIACYTLATCSRQLLVVPMARFPIIQCRPIWSSSVCRVILLNEVWLLVAERVGVGSLRALGPLLLSPIAHHVEFRGCWLPNVGGILAWSTEQGGRRWLTRGYRCFCQTLMERVCAKCWWHPLPIVLSCLESVWREGHTVVRHSTGVETGSRLPRNGANVHVWSNL
mmetsp:Transcript_15144/g.23576  ORF Transcript_15144/g.23576 Transcript_15144/m.23576 type:complete len:217 (+) Transcript_15144:439-1089(+)